MNTDNSKQSSWRFQPFYLAVVLLAITGSSLFAAERINQTRTGVAIKGYDPVAYFVDEKAVEGSKSYTSEWQGATWYFHDEKHRDLFAHVPEKYAPQYGGYCAYAVSKGSLAAVDPEAWTIHEGKLYLNLSRRVRELWSRDIPGNIAKADANWPAVLEDR